MISLAIASLSLLLWVYLVCGHGGFWRSDQREDAGAKPIAWPRVVAVVPARDEAELIGDTLSSLLLQDYAGAFSIVVVDDHSTDDTARIATTAAASCGMADRLVTIAAPSLPDRWTGKLWALQHGIAHAESMAEPPDYLWLTDADIRHSPQVLSGLVARAGRRRLVVTSLMAKLRCEAVVERASMPAFVFFFQMLYPFAWVNRHDRATAAAAGGCMLVHRAALRRAGGIAAIRDEIIDDCALARHLKRQGPIAIGLSDLVQSARAYRSYQAVRRMIIRSAFAQLRYSSWLLALTIIAMAIVFVVPPVAAFFADGASSIVGFVTWALMAIAFQPTLRFYRVSPLWGVALPAIATCYMALTIDSAIQHARGRGGEWKGRVRRAASVGAASRPRESHQAQNANGG